MQSIGFETIYCEDLNLGSCQLAKEVIGLNRVAEILHVHSQI